MSVRGMAGLLGAVVGLLVTAWFTQAASLWSDLANDTVPWFCGMLSLAILVVTVTTVLSGTSPGAIPLSRVLVVTPLASLALGVGMAVDGVCYGIPDDWIGSVGEWYAFTVTLVILFWIPRSRQGAAEKQDAHREL